MQYKAVFGYDGENEEIAEVVEADSVDYWAEVGSVILRKGSEVVLVAPVQSLVYIRAMDSVETEKS